MNVAELIAELQKMPQDAEISHVWDGCARTNINFVWLAKSGEVVTADYGQVVYDDRDRPANAPVSKDERYWQTPDKPNVF